MSTSLPISRLIDVNVNLSQQGAQAQNLNAMLVLGSSSVIDVATRIRNYTSLAQVAADFGTNAPEYLAALLWFEQAPQPTQLYIGRWAKAATPGQLFGGPLSATQQAIALFNAITTGAFFVYVDGVPITVSGLNFSASANLNAVAAAIQAVLVGLAAGSTVVWNAIYNRFEVTSGTTGAASSLSFIVAPTASGFFNFTGQPSPADTITLNGTVVTFVAGSPSGNQVQIGGSVAATLANLLAFLKASSDTQIVKFTYSVVGVKLYVVAVATGVAGNSLTIAKSGANIAVSGATLSGGSGTDISAMLVATSILVGAYLAPGVIAETALAAVTTMDTQFGQKWFGLTALGVADSDHLAIAAFIEGANNAHYYGVTTQEPTVLTPGDSSSIASQLQAAKYTRTAVQYSLSSAYAVVSLLARILTTDYTGNNTVITLMYKQEPGIVAETLTTTQISALEAKNCNVFASYNNNTAIIEPGVSSSGDFIDSIIGALALGITIQTAIYNVLYTSTTKIPQTDAGTHLITSAIADVCAQFVADGLLAPGQWNSQGFGTLNQGDQMPNGFYIYAPPVSTQTEAVRATRVSVPIQIAAKLAGAVHTANVTITVNP